MPKSNISRIPVFISLVCSTMLFGGLSYFIFYANETLLLKTQLQSVDSLFDFAIKNEIEDKKNALLLMSEYMTSEFPNASTWPYVSVPKETFTKITDPLIEMAKLRTLGLLPIVETHEVEKFETFIEDFFIEQGYDSDLGVSDFGFGMYSQNISTGERYHTTNAEKTAEGMHDILLPIIQTGNLEQNTAAVMYNIYAEYHRASAVDYILQCDNATVDCVSVSNFIHIVQDGVYRPAALVLYPIHVEGVAVGAIHGVINWDDVIEGSVPDFAKGIEISIKSDYEGETAHFKYDAPGTTYKAQTISEGHKPFHSIEVDLKYTKYTISLSLTDEYEAKQRTFGPVIACVIAVTITLFTALIFVLYDRSINHDLLQKELDVETKRLFVRYISHEIRTPLNTVHLGLQVLHDEMKNFIDSGVLDRMSSYEVEPYKEIMEEWTNFITNIDDSAEDAISVLSDLLDFDKVSTGMLNIERDIHDISSLLSDTAKPFSVNARSKNIQLTFMTLPPIECEEVTHIVSSHTGMGTSRVTPITSIDHNKLTSNDTTNRSLIEDYRPEQPIMMFGDDIKIQQVIRNLVSNALKFTPDGGTVDIIACWDKNGVAHASSKVKAVVVPEDFLPAGCVVVKVKDSGAGMTSEQVSQLFQEGVQFDANKLQAGQGSGLGLWISKEVVAQHCGSLRAESNGKGHGSMFILELPVFLSRPIPLPSPNGSLNKDRMDSDSSSNEMTDVLAPIKPKTKTPSRYSLTSASKQTMALSHRVHPSPQSSASNSLNDSNSPTHPSELDTKAYFDSFPTIENGTNKDNETKMNNEEGLNAEVCVLVVDDSASTRKVVCRLLKNLGCITLEAADGQECLNLLAVESKHNTIDMILMDYEMPNMNGPVTTDQLTKELGCKIPIIGVTGNAYKEDRIKFMNCGAVEVIVKPLNIELLKTMLSTFSPRFYNMSLIKHGTNSTHMTKSENKHEPSIKNKLKLAPLTNRAVTDLTSPDSTGFVTPDGVLNNSLSPMLPPNDIRARARSHSGDNGGVKNATFQVLVVDDVTSTRKVICRLLKNIGCITLEAGDGQECLDVVTRNLSSATAPPIDMILMDYEMPIMNGPTATTKLKKLGIETPIIGVTGNVLKADTDYFKQMGALEVLHKPLTILKVKSLLSRWLHHDIALSSSSSSQYAVPIDSPNLDPFSTVGEIL